MPRVLFLDDNPDRTKKFRSWFPSAETAETADEIIALLIKGDTDHLFLDHDLGGEVYVDPDLPNTGMAVVRWIEENKPSIEKIIIHSLNADRAVEMVVRLTLAGYQASRNPFTKLLELMEGCPWSE